MITRKPPPERMLGDWEKTYSAISYVLEVEPKSEATPAGLR